MAKDQKLALKKLEHNKGMVIHLVYKSNAPVVLNKNCNHKMNELMKDANEREPYHQGRKLLMHGKRSRAEVACPVYRGSPWSAITVNVTQKEFLLHLSFQPPVLQLGLMLPSLLPPHLLSLISMVLHLCQE